MNLTRRRVLAARLSVALAICLALTPGATRPTLAQASNVVYVGPGGDCGGATPCYSRIQEAITEVGAPDSTVIVLPGTYNESVAVLKSVRLLGPNAGVDARGPRGPEAAISRNDTDPTIWIYGATATVDGFTIQDGGGGDRAGVCVSGSHGVEIRNNILTGNADAIFWNTDSPGTIHHNLFLDNSVNGLMLYNSTGLVVDHNEFRNSRIGQNTVPQSGLQLTNNTFVADGHTRLGLSHLSQATISHNTFTDGAIILWGYSTDVSIVGNTISNTNALVPTVQSPITLACPGSGIGANRNITVTANLIEQDVAAFDSNRPAIDLKSVAGSAVMSGNVITLSGTFSGTVSAAHGISTSGQMQTVLIEGNELHGGDVDPGWPQPSAGIWLDHDIGTSPVLRITGNDISGFVHGIYAERLPNSPDLQIRGNSLAGQSEKGVYSPSGRTVDASGNWWGTNDPAEVAGRVYGDVDYTPWLDSGVDTDALAPGFQGDYTVLNVGPDGLQTGDVGRIQEGVDLVDLGTVKVAAGTYTETAEISQTVSLLGAQHGVDARTRSGVDESVLQGSGSQFIVGADDVVIDGFRFQDIEAGTPDAAAISLASTHSGYRIRNSLFLNSHHALWLNCSGIRQTAVEENAFRADSYIYSDQGLANALVQDNEFAGAGAAAMTFNGSVSDLTIVGNESMTSQGGLALVDTQAVTVTGNVFGQNADYGVLLSGNEGVLVLSNTVSANGAGVLLAADPDGPGTDTCIAGNAFEGNSYGIRALASATPETVDVHFNRFLGNTEAGIESQSANLLDADNNWWASPTGPTPFGSGDAISGTVDCLPWLGANVLPGSVVVARVMSGTLRARAEANTEVDVDGAGLAIAAKYVGNPAGTPPFDSVVGDFADAYLDNQDGVTLATIRYYYPEAAPESGLRLWWWDGSAWRLFSQQGIDTTGVDGYGGYLWARVTVSSVPALDDLAGLPLVGGNMPHLLWLPLALRH